jgi:transposase-like protein
VPSRSRVSRPRGVADATAYVEGVSTRRVDDLVEAMGIAGTSKSEVSRSAGELDAKVAEFRDRPLDGGPYRNLWIEALERHEAFSTVPW